MATTVKVAPLQVPLVGVTVYVAVCAILVGFVRVPAILACALALTPPVKFPVTLGALHA